MADMGGMVGERITSSLPAVLTPRATLGTQLVGKALICPLPTNAQGSSTPLSLGVLLPKVRALSPWP